MVSEVYNKASVGSDEFFVIEAAERKMGALLRKCRIRQIAVGPVAIDHPFIALPQVTRRSECY
jgi:hypothetical protein